MEEDNNNNATVDDNNPTDIIATATDLQNCDHKLELIRLVLQKIKNSPRKVAEVYHEKACVVAKAKGWAPSLQL